MGAAERGLLLGEGEAPICLEAGADPKPLKAGRPEDANVHAHVRFV